MSRKNQHLARFIPVFAAGGSEKVSGGIDRVMAVLSATYDSRPGFFLRSPTMIADPSRGGGRSVGH